MVNMNEYFCFFCHIIEPEASLIDFLCKIAELIGNVIIIIGGIFGIVYIKKLKEKRLNAAFGFFSKFSLRLKSISYLFEQNKNTILNSLVNPSDRSKLADIDNSYSQKSVDELVKKALETINFLMEENDQMPVFIGWIDKYNNFISFLETICQLSNSNFFLWNEFDETKQEEFYNTHSENIKGMIDDIYKFQKQTEKTA